MIRSSIRRLYSTTGGHAEGKFSEPTCAQPVKQIITIPRAAAGGIEHLAVDGMGALQVIDPLGGAACALALAAEVEGKEGDGERCEGVTCPRVIETSHSRVNPDEIFDTGLFDFDEAHTHPMWAKELYGFANHTPETEEYGRLAAS